MYVNIYIPIIYSSYIYIHNFPLILLFCLGASNKVWTEVRSTDNLPCFHYKVQY